ncbi:hypothetical protein N7536_001035 [Penicillium majusculum]|nr:hypothetical protein N7536_001035 [Penicillium majusculum]
MASLSFRGKNDGLQVGDYRGSVTAEFHLPAGKLEGRNTLAIVTNYRILVRPETPPSPLSTVPFPRDPDFVSRDKLLHSIREKNSVPGSRIALIGLGGVGKSQLAIEYSYLVRSEFPATWVFWIHASNQARFEQSFRDIADHIQVQGRHDPNVDIFKLVENWLRDEKHGKWICILDNADDEKLLCSSLTVGKEDPTKGLTNAFTKPLLEYVPRSQNGSTIITSRTREVVLKLVDRKDLIEVRPMETPEALELLQKKLQQVRNSEQSQQLVDTLEFMPLAIVQAASYIRHRAPRYSVSQYLSDFQGSERKATQLLKEEVGHLYRDWEAKNSILVAWQISFEYIRRIKLSAADLLSFMSFFDQQEIPENIIRHQIDARYISILELLNELSDGERSESDIGSEFEDDIRTLRDFSFITTSKDGSCFMMNRLVQLATRVWLKSNGQTEEWREKFISTLCHEFAPGGYKNWEKCRLLFPHVKSSISQKPESPEHLLEWADLLYRGAWYASDCGLITDMREMAWKSRKHRVNILGVENEASLKSSAMLAEAYSLEGRWEEAEQLEVQVMETRKTKLGDDHPDTLTSMANLASTYRNQGRWGEAEQLEVQVMETRRMELGEDYPDTLMSMANMASTYWNQGRWEEAEQLGLQVMETRKQVLGDDHPDTLISMANLASTYWNQGRWEEAEQLEVQVMETRKTKLGDDHSDTLISMANLASTYWNQGRWEEAEQLEVQVMETCKTKLGDDHPDTLTSMANLASTYQNQGRWEETEQLEVHVMETRTIKLGEDHPDTLTSIASLASMYRNQGRWQEAEQLGLQVMETRKQVLGDDHPHTLTSMANLVSTYWNQGRWEEAEQLEVQVMETRKTKLGGDHPDTLTSIASLASMYRNQGRWQEAEQFEAQVMETRKTKLGPHYSDSVDFVHSDSSSENDSVFSVPVSITSTRSLDSGRGEMNSLLIREFANLLHDDGDLLSLLLVGLSKELIGFERMRNNFRRMLKHFANNLNADILSESHRDLRSFVSSYSAMITRELFAMAPIDKERNIKPHVLEAGHRIASAEKRLTHERKVEFYLQDLHRDGPAPRTSESIGIFNSDDEESDQDSVAEEAGEDEPYEGSLQNLDRMRYFILESAAYQILRRRLEGFVRPSLHSRARDLVTRWSAPGHKNYGDVARYNLRNLISELQHVNPHEIQFERDRNTCRFFSFVGHYQYMIERWTGEPWDWWPLPHCPRALAESEARLQWKCVSI